MKPLVVATGQIHYTKANPRALLLFVIFICGCNWSTPTPKEFAKQRLALAQRGDKEAAWDVAQCFLDGSGVPADLAEAEHWFEIGATTPSRKALVAAMHARGKSFPKDIEAAARWYVAAGRPSDLFELAEHYKGAAETDDPLPANTTLRPPLSISNC